MPTRCNRRFLLQILLFAQHVSGTIMPIIRSSTVLYKWLLPVVFGALVFKLSVWCGAEGCVSGFRAAAARCPETCWASNKICNKNHLLHLVGIWFPHIVYMKLISYKPRAFIQTWCLRKSCRSHETDISHSTGMRNGMTGGKIKKKKTHIFYRY